MLCNSIMACFQCFYRYVCISFRIISFFILACLQLFFLYADWFLSLCLCFFSYYFFLYTASSCSFFMLACLQFVFLISLFRVLFPSLWPRLSSEAHCTSCNVVQQCPSRASSCACYFSTTSLVFSFLYATVAPWLCFSFMTALVLCLCNSRSLAVLFFYDFLVGAFIFLPTPNLFLKYSLRYGTFRPLLF